MADNLPPDPQTPPPAPQAPATEPAVDPVLEAVELDPAQQSLADALRVCFGILKFVMVVLLVIYLFSGMFTLQANEKAVRLRFGQFVETDGQKILERGTHFAAPYPIEKVIKIDTRRRTIELEEPFWAGLNRQQMGRTREEAARYAQPLNPERDGSLLTGDSSIIHAKWTVSYSIDNPLEFARTVGSTEKAEKLVRAAAEQGIVHAVAQFPAKDLLLKVANTSTARDVANQSLMDMETGLVVEGIGFTEATVPGKVLQAFNAVTAAESEKASLILQAKQERARILGEAAGENYEALLALVGHYQEVSQTGTPQEIAQANEQLDAALMALRVPGSDARIGGQVASVINEARTYRAQVGEQIASEAGQFREMLPAFEKNPVLTMSRLWEESKGRILSGDVESFYLPASESVLMLNRDPDTMRKRQEERLREIDRNRLPASGS